MTRKYKGESLLFRFISLRKISQKISNTYDINYDETYMKGRSETGVCV